jgi:hypothetical protein
VGVQHRLRSCLTLVVLKWWQFNFIFNRGKGIKSQGAKSRDQGGWRKAVVLILLKKFHGEKGNIKRCVFVMQQQVHFTQTFESKSSQIFTQSSQNFKVVCEIKGLA